jgi:DNA-binding NarL/FixJ family response regulator
LSVAIARDTEFAVRSREPSVGEAPALAIRVAVLGPAGLPDVSAVLEAEGLHVLRGDPDVAADAMVAVAATPESILDLAAPPDCPLIVVLPDSASADREVVRGLLARGINAIVGASRVESALAPSVRAACAGQIVVPAEARKAMARPTLTVREKQVLGMVVLGFTNGEIARKLHLAESTVKSHLSSAFPKLGVRSRREAAAAILDPKTGLGTGILAISEAEGFAV